ncbi:MAG: hypothetical protein Q8K24_06735 [Hydrogenophaga sp.]|nr:hypothetical protein [Hydrogenophaga sp.]
MSVSRSLHRLWQPRRGLFWLVLAFNALSSLLAWYVHLTDPPTALRWVLSLLALTNAGLGWWMLVRLWRETPPEPPRHPRGGAG